MDENNAAPARDASEASENINQVTQAADGAIDSSSATAEQVAKFLGTDAATLEEFTKFTNANGKFNKAFDVFKSKISNPAPAAEPAKSAEQKPVEPAQSAEPVARPYTPPEGAITQQEIFAKTYFDSLASQEKYAGISKEISSGAVLKEMAELGIQVMNPDGSINAGTVTKYLDRIAKTVPARQSGAEPEAAAAPTVDYVPVGENIKTADEARQVIMQDTQLRARGMAGHPAAQKAEEFLRNLLSKGSK